jgi:hypothetical protein
MRNESSAMIVHYLTIRSLNTSSESKKRQNWVWKITGLSFTFLKHFAFTRTLKENKLCIYPTHWKGRVFQVTAVVQLVIFLIAHIKTTIHQCISSAVASFAYLSIEVEHVGAGPRHACIYFSRQQTGTPRNLIRRTWAINHAPAPAA